MIGVPTIFTTSGQCSHHFSPSYSWNIYIYTSLEHSLLVTMTNDTCIKSSMSNQAYKVVGTHAHEISWKILYIIIHSCDPRIGGMNGNVQSDLATLSFKNREQPEYFHSRILILQQKIILSE